MKVRMEPTPTPYVTVAPDDVVVTDIESSLSGGLSAYGRLRSEDRMMPVPIAGYTGPIITTEIVHGPKYRVAYMDANGHWQAEGTIRRERPPESIMKQISRLLHPDR